MELVIYILVSVFLLFVGIMFGVSETKNHTKKEYAGSLVIVSDGDGGSYLFLDTAMTPGDIARHKEIVLKVETQNSQSPL